MLQERPGGLRSSQGSPGEADNRASRLEARKLEGRGSRVDRGSRVEAAGPRLGVLPEELLEVQGGSRGAGGKPELQKGGLRGPGESRRGG